MNKKLGMFTKLAIVTALYVAVTLVLAPMSFGVIQLRFSESFNHLVMYDKRYIGAVTLGVAIANLFFSPLGVIDMAIGASATLMMLTISYFLTRKMTNLKVKMTTNIIVCSTIGMVPIALMLYYFTDWPAPLLTIYGTVMLGQIVSMTIGALVIYFVGKRVKFGE